MNIDSHKIALSVDIEDWYHTPMVTGSPFSVYKDTRAFFEEWKGPYDYITQPTLRLLSLFDRFSIKATFFVVAEVIDRYPEIVTALKYSPHEIACHGLHHHCAIDGKTKAPLCPPSDWEAELIIAKELLESVFERRVIGYRAPGGYVAGWMLPILRDTGFLYDSSVSANSFYNKTDHRYLNIPDQPYRLQQYGFLESEQDEGLIELPWSSVRMLGLRWPVAGAFFFRALGLRFFKYAIRRNLRKHDTMFYFHSLDVCNERIPVSNFRRRPFYWINHGEKTYAKLERLLAHFQGQFVSCEEIYRRTLAGNLNKMNDGSL